MSKHTPPKYVYAVSQEDDGIYLYVSNQQIFEETGYASDHDYFPTDEDGKPVDLGFDLEELMEGVFATCDPTVTLKMVKEQLADCPRFVASSAFEALIRNSK
jgi:hypothetical protein